MELESLLVLGLASATISVTLGSSRLFKPLREWVKGHSEWAGDLISCPYCLGHWASVALTMWWWYYEFPYPVEPWRYPAVIPHIVVVWLATTALSALIAGTITLLFTGGGGDDASN